MSEEPTDQEAQDAAALQRALDGEDPAPDHQAQDAAALQRAMDSLVKQYRKIYGPPAGEKAPRTPIAERVQALERYIADYECGMTMATRPSIENRVAALEKFIEEEM